MMVGILEEMADRMDMKVEVTFYPDGKIKSI
jgi:hypothetical protein